MRRQTKTGACDGKYFIYFKGFAKGVKSSGDREIGKSGQLIIGRPASKEHQSVNPQSTLAHP
jgi:hypothetical protein